MAPIDLSDTELVARIASLCLDAHRLTATSEPPGPRSIGRLHHSATASLGVSSYPQHGKTPDELTLAADAIYLDGFAPDRNPELWSDPVIAQVRRLAAPGATFATWTTAGAVRRRLAGADFSIERRPGFGGKREMLSGRLPGGCTAYALRPLICRLFGFSAVRDKLSWGRGGVF